MKKTAILLIFIASSFFANAQKIDSVFLNLYTDSLKKGTYNYINVDGLMSNGKYLPLDTNHLVFISDKGEFFGNSLWLDPDFSEKKVHISISLRSNAAITKEFDMYIKTIEDPDNLKTNEQILEEYKQRARTKKKKRG